MLVDIFLFPLVSAVVLNRPISLAGEGEFCLGRQASTVEQDRALARLQRRIHIAGKSSLPWPTEALVWQDEVTWHCTMIT